MGTLSYKLKAVACRVALHMCVSFHVETARWGYERPDSQALEAPAVQYKKMFDVWLVTSSCITLRIVWYQYFQNVDEHFRAIQFVIRDLLLDLAVREFKIWNFEFDMSEALNAENVS